MKEFEGRFKIEEDSHPIEIKTMPPKQEKPLIADLRNRLKDILQKELDELPELLKELDPAQRVNILCKLMPFVLPKTESVRPEFGEPDEFKMKRYYP